MNDHDQSFHFGNELDNLVERTRKEYDLSYATIIGILHVKAHQLCSECLEEEDE